MSKLKFFVPSVKVGALPPLPGPGHASIKESCRMQALHYRVSPEFPIQDLVRELSSVWGTPDRSNAVLGSKYGLPGNIYGDIAIWDHAGVSGPSFLRVGSLAISHPVRNDAFIDFAFEIEAARLPFTLELWPSKIRTSSSRVTA
jgi:hypothetical protein